MHAVLGVDTLTILYCTVPCPMQPPLVSRLIPQEASTNRSVYCCSFTAHTIGRISQLNNAFSVANMLHVEFIDFVLLFPLITFHRCTPLIIL